MTGIELRGVYKSFGEKNVLSDFSHIFPKGETSCVMGPSGCGKTTLMRLVLGLEKPDAGEIILPENTTFGCVFQEDRLINHLSAKKNLRLVQKNKNEAAIDEILNELGLGGSADVPVKQLSGGMARRVALARALIYDCDTLIMDEPLKGLDESTKDRAISTIKRYSQGKALILITHDVAEAQSFGGEMVKLRLI